MRTPGLLALLLTLLAPVNPATADVRSVGSITGIVLDEAGTGVADATVTVTRDDGRQRLEHSDASGAFTLSRLPPGSYVLQVEREYFGVSVVTVQVGASTSVSDLRITLYAAG